MSQGKLEEVWTHITIKRITTSKYSKATVFNQDQKKKKAVGNY